MGSALFSPQICIIFTPGPIFNRKFTLRPLLSEMITKLLKIVFLPLRNFVKEFENWKVLREFFD